VTAVEWLKKQLEDYGSISHLTLDWNTFDELCEKAKEMEKEQSEKYANYVLELFKKDTNPMSFNLWNKTYGGNNEQ